MSRIITESTKRLLVNQIDFTKPAITIRELKSVLDCLFRDEISFGKIVEKLETKCGESLGFKNSLVLPSHHSAYHLAFLALGLREGEEVVIPSIAPLACLDAIGYFKATPKVIDIAQDSFHPSIETFTTKITDKTKAVLLPYRFGSFKNYESLYQALSQQRERIKFIEDISEAPGTSFLGKPIGYNSDITLLSLEESMPLTMGKGSVFLTNSKSIYQIANDLRNPINATGLSYRTRYDYTITDYQAAIGIEQIDKMTALFELRKRIARLYFKEVEKSQFKNFFNYPESDGYGAFPIVSPTNKEETIAHFKKKKIETKEISPYEPLHRLLKLAKVNFPNTERLYQKGVLIPLHPHLNQKDINKVISCFRRMLH